MWAVPVQRLRSIFSGGCNMTVARFWRKIPQRYNLVGTKCDLWPALLPTADILPGLPQDR